MSNFGIFLVWWAFFGCSILVYFLVWRVYFGVIFSMDSFLLFNLSMESLFWLFNLSVFLAWTVFLLFNFRVFLEWRAFWLFNFGVFLLWRASFGCLILVYFYYGKLHLVVNFDVFTVWRASFACLIWVFL